MRDSVPSGSYSSVCNVLRQWKSRSSLLIESTDSMIIIIISTLFPLAMWLLIILFQCYCNAESIQGWRLIVTGTHMQP